MKKIISGLLVLLALLLPAVSRADGREGGAAGVWTVRAENGEVLCTLADEAHVGDEYISGDNRRYEILSADAAAHTAVARDRGAQEMPEVSGRDGKEGSAHRHVFHPQRRKLRAHRRHRQR